MELTGHNNIETIQLYIDIRPADIKAAVDALTSKDPEECTIKSLLIRNTAHEDEHLMRVMLDAKDSLLNDQVKLLLVRSKNISGMSYRHSVGNSGLDNIPWLLSGFNRNKALTLTSNSHLSLFRLLLLPTIIPSSSRASVYTCKCGLEVDLNCSYEH